MLVTGRVTVLLCFSVVGLTVLLHVPRIELRCQPAQLESRRSLWGLALTLVVCAFVPLSVWRRWGALENTLPAALSIPLTAVGAVACYATLSWLAWAGVTLGRAAHFVARVDQGGRLVKEGPFQMVRHPVYFGLGMLFAASALAGLSWWAAVAAALWWPLAAWRAAIEDQILAQAFGEDFTRYAARVPRLWPWARREPAAHSA